MTYSFLFCYQCFPLFHQQAPSIQWLIECGCFLFSLPCVTENTDKSKREVNQTDSVGGLGGRKTDRDRQNDKKL